jgi:hypothetical protein
MAEQRTFNPLVQGSTPWRPTAVSKIRTVDPWTGSWTEDSAPSGHIEQLPSGSWHAKVYARKDPLTGREIRFRKTRRTEVEAQIELCRLLELARSGRNPDSGVTVAELLDALRPRRRVGGFHGGSQPRLHPPHYQARARDQGGAQGPRPAAG